MNQTRVLALDGINNFRDYGDYAVAGGRRVRKGQLWRSGQHVAATAPDLAAIAPIAFTTVIDLRGASERETNPCRRGDGFAAEVICSEGETAGLASHIDAGNEAIDVATARGAMCRLYAGMPYRETLVPVIAAYFRALATRDGASLIHCFAGKDRTGFAVALAHHVLGVHRDDAMADYLLTNEAMKGRKMHGVSAGDPGRYARLSEDARQALWGVRPEYLETAFAAIRASHGTLDSYLAEALGVDVGLRDAIRARFVEG